MGHLTVYARGPLPAETVWERYAVPARWHTWAPHIRSVEYVGTRVSAGARGRIRGPLGANASFVVDSVDEAGWTWEWTVTAGFRNRPVVTLSLHHDVQPRGSGSWTSLGLDGPGIAIAAYAPLAWYALHRLTR